MQHNTITNNKCKIPKIEVIEAVNWYICKIKGSNCETITSLSLKPLKTV